MLKPETMGYIIEKMRGDSLTPLGTGKGVGKDITHYPDYGIEVVGYITRGLRARAMRRLVKALNLPESYTVSYGKWEIVVDATKFYNSGFYYKAKLADGTKLYLFHYFYGSTFQGYELRLGCSLASSFALIGNSSATVASAGETLESLDAFLKKVFGIRTFVDDYGNYKAV